MNLLSGVLCVCVRRLRVLIVLHCSRTPHVCRTWFVFDDDANYGDGVVDDGYGVGANVDLTPMPVYVDAHSHSLMLSMASIALHMIAYRAHWGQLMLDTSLRTTC